MGETRPRFLSPFVIGWVVCFFAEWPDATESSRGAVAHLSRTGLILILIMTAVKQYLSVSLSLYFSREPRFDPLPRGRRLAYGWGGSQCAGGGHREREHGRVVDAPSRAARLFVWQGGVRDDDIDNLYR